MADHKIICGNALDVLRTLETGSVHLCCTSPPYFGLRNYNADGQIGLEATPQEFVAKMVEVFSEVRRVLRSDGVLFLNLGDSYAGSNKGVMADGSIVGGKKQQSHVGTMTGGIPQSGDYEGFKPKDLMLMPHRVVIALQDAGWWIRSDMPWVKRSAMPESVTDRPAKALEYVFILTKSAKYFFDAQAVRVQMAESSLAQYKQGYDGKGIKDYEANGVQNPSEIKARMIAKHNRDRSLPTNRNGITGSLDETPAGGRNFRNSDLWFASIKEPHGLVGVGDELVGLDVNPSGFKESHFATFPPKLIEPLIKAGTSEKGVCAACGSPWERVVDRQRIRRDELNVTDSRYRPNQYHGAYEEINGKGDAGYSEVTTLGWQKTCKCETDEVVPATVLDPFAGAGTTMLVAKRLGRRSIGIELNPDYIKMIERRLEHYHKPAPPPVKTDADLPLFSEVNA